jgi:chloramphenicol O-acetyltransferase type A
MSGHFIELGNWPRRSHFEFFSRYSNPFFNVTVQVDVAATHAWCAGHDRSFFLATLFLATSAANDIEAFRLRLRPEGIWLHDRIHAGSTVLRDDETFGFCYFDYSGHFGEFERAGRERIDALRTSLPTLDDRASRDDLIHFSVLPWIAFTSFSHARQWDSGESVPRIVFGKRHGKEGSEVMPVSVELHHGLADGLHVGQFLEDLQDRLNEPGSHLKG